MIAAKLYKHVLDKNQEPTGDTLRAALLEIREFDGPLTGKTIVDGHHVQKPVYLLTVENGNFVPMAKIDS
jgi:branched-chain amino acid transport system substrate-binding protein